MCRPVVASNVLDIKIGYGSSHESSSGVRFAEVFCALQNCATGSCIINPVFDRDRSRNARLLNGNQPLIDSCC